MSTPRRALVVVDVQQEYFDGPLEVQFPPREESVAKIVAAVHVATKAGIPVVVVQHTLGEGAPVFDPTTSRHDLHPLLEQRRTPEWTSISKQFGTVFAGTDLLAWLRSSDIDTVTFVGYMSNNCILASAAESETHGLIWKVVLSRGQGEAPALLGAGRAPLVSSGVAWLVSVSLVDARSD